MSPRVLHVLSQRPSLTGSGVTLDALARHAQAAGWEQRAIVGVPADDRRPLVGELPPEQIHPLRFGRGGDVPFALPGMSDVMPYPSSRFSALEPQQIERYRDSWHAHLRGVVTAWRPDLVHSHHIWIVSSLLKDVAPEIPVVTHCHGTGLRQLALCPHLADAVRAGCRRNERFCALHRAHARQLVAELQVDAEAVAVVRAGYRAELFRRDERTPRAPRTVLYAGKLSAAKGLPWLLDAFARLAAEDPQITLHVAGSGAGAEADALRARVLALAPRAVYHGQLDQRGLAALMQRCEVFALPSLFEGLPLVLVEAAACGCRAVCTALPGVVEELAPQLGDALTLVPLPRLQGPDTPLAADRPRFVDALATGLRAALAAPAHFVELRAFTWEAVFERVQQVWRQALAQRPAPAPAQPPPRSPPG